VTTGLLTMGLFTLVCGYKNILINIIAAWVKVQFQEDLTGEVSFFVVPKILEKKLIVI
jgi:hypothetical protein